jgi:site-specific DNA recombinase
MSSHGTIKRMAQDYERDCVIYLRKSKGKAGIDRQRKEDRAYAERLRWRVIAEFTEPNTTAFAKVGEEDAPRPEYEQMIEFLQRDDRSPALGIIAWHPDRLSRNSGEVRPFIAVCAKGGHLVDTPRAGRYDLSLPSGRKRFRDDISDAEGEVDHLIERVDAQKAEAASEGRFLGGGRPFGFKRDGVRHKESEAELIRQACRDVLAGDSIRSIARRWNEQGIPTAGRASEWSTRAVWRLLVRPRNAGLMLWRGQVIGAASWEPVVDEATWRAVVRTLEDPARRTTPGSVRRWLGSGLYVCGVCGQPNLGVRKAGPAGPTGNRRAYKCGPGNHVSRDAEALDAYVGEHVVAWLSRPNARELLHANDREDVANLEAELLAKRGEVDKWRAAAGAGEVSLAAFRPVEQRLLAEIAEVEAQLIRPDRALILRDLIEAPDVGVAWLAAPLDRQRAVLAELFTVTVLPARRGRPKGRRPGEPCFDPEFIDVTPV